MKGNIKLSVFLILAALVAFMLSIIKLTFHLPIIWMGLPTSMVLFYSLYSTKEDDSDYEEIIVEEEIEVDVDTANDERKEIIVEIDDKDKSILKEALKNRIDNSTVNLRSEFSLQLKIGILGCLSGFLITLGFESIFRFFLDVNKSIAIIEIILGILGYLLMKFAIKLQRQKTAL